MIVAAIQRWMTVICSAVLSQGKIIIAATPREHAGGLVGCVAAEQQQHGRPVGSDRTTATSFGAADDGEDGSARGVAGRRR